MDAKHVDEKRCGAISGVNDTKWDIHNPSQDTICTCGKKYGGGGAVWGVQCGGG